MKTQRGAYAQGTVLLACLWVTVAAPGCARVPTPGEPPGVAVPITAVAMVVGTWKGVVYRVPDMEAQALVRLSLHENATYTFVDITGSSPLLGAGTLTLQDGRLTEETERRVTMALYERGARRILVVEGTGKTGVRIYAEFTPH